MLVGILLYIGLLKRADVGSLAQNAQKQSYIITAGLIAVFDSTLSDTELSLDTSIVGCATSDATFACLRTNE